MIDTPGPSVPMRDVLSDVLRLVRLTGSIQFCVASAGSWRTDPRPSRAFFVGTAEVTVPFHVVIEGACWVEVHGRRWSLAAGDVIAFPTGVGHVVDAGRGGPEVSPYDDLPSKPWLDLPVLHYGDAQGSPALRLLCGYLQCDAIGFAPLRASLPEVVHIDGSDPRFGGWLAATVRQMAEEADRPRPGGVTVLERLTELMFIEILRRQILDTSSAVARGWLAALADPALSRVLALIHGDPSREWTVQDLAASAALSRTALADRFADALGTSPIRYLRDWRLFLASQALRQGRRAISEVAWEAGYGSEAAFNRAFARTFGIPPARWRATAQEAAGSA